jgi:hypothetical protein
MNYININNYADLQYLLNVDILITGDLSQQKEELYYNTWCLNFDKDFVKTLSITDLQNFIQELIDNRAKQVININKGSATFYLWYDEQSFNLCFDILSGKNIKLPFGCKLNILKKTDSILEKFLADTQAETNYLSWENLKIINRGDPGWDKDDENDVPEWIGNVYVTTLPQPTFINFIKKIVS